MLIDAPGVRTRLHNIVERLAGNAALRGDLMQEALIHLWGLEQGRPGQSLHWYLRGCRYHLKNFLRRGRSVDSIKRHRAQISNADRAENSSDLLHSRQADGGFWDEVSVKDLIAVVSKSLKRAEKDTLVCLAEGLSAREIAKRLRVSHTLVNRHRNRIATVALSLGISPISPMARASSGEHPGLAEESKLPHAGRYDSSNRL